MAYGGLRGGVGFSLLKMIEVDIIPAANIFVTTGLMVVMSTVWIQGKTFFYKGNIFQIDFILNVPSRINYKAPS